MTDIKNKFEQKTQVRSKPERSTGRVFAFEIVEGPGAGSTFTYDETFPSSVLVGSSVACTFRVQDPEASRRHATLDRQGDEIRILDLTSTNGTFVNGVRIREATLAGGELLRFGSTTVRVERTGATNVPALSTASSFGRLHGESVPMRRIYTLAERIAHADFPFLLEGESGTGKETMAEAIHFASARKAGPFETFDCVANGNTEAALFGDAQNRSAFEVANDGSLFLDEVGALGLESQAKLARFLERGELRRAGSSDTFSANVRVIASTRKNLDQLVQEGRFREDLFSKLAVSRIEMPAIRYRLEDVGVLASLFWTELGGAGTIPEDFLTTLRDYSWPGNVRELKEMVGQRIVLGEMAPLTLRGTRDSFVPPPMGQDAVDKILAMDLPLTISRQKLVDDFERKYVERILEKHGGNVTRAAQASGLAHRYFQLLRARQRGTK